MEVELGPYKAFDGMFTYYETMGILTLSDSMYNALHGPLASVKDQYSEIQGNDTYHILKIKKSNRN